MGWIIGLVVASLLVCRGHCGDRIPEKLCATLFSKNDFKGDSFKLNDFHQSVNLRRDYRPGIEGWPETKSVKVEKGCNLALCSDTNFLGKCQFLSADKAALDSDVRSVNCTCKRNCRCESIAVPQDEKPNGYVGRAYLKGGCSTCNADYLNLRKNKNFPEADRGSVEAFILSKECNLTVCTEPYYKGEEIPIPGPIYEDFSGRVGSYKEYCDEVASQEEYSDEFGLSPWGAARDEKMRKQSARNRRSSKNAYVLLIGAHITYYLGFPQCKDTINDTIWECRLPVTLKGEDKSAELRVITVPMGYVSPQHDFRLTASLKRYLSSHSELQNAIPNAVIVYHWIHGKDFLEEGGIYQRKLQAVQTLRAELLDENYSNLVFLLDDIGLLPTEKLRRQPEAKIVQFEEMLRKKWNFPKPLNFVLKLISQPETRFVNGHMRMPNGEYFPLNLQVTLDNICGEKGRDPLGQAVLQAAFRDDHTTHYSLPQILYESPESPEGEESCCNTLINQIAEIDQLKADFALGKKKRLENNEGLMEKVWQQLKEKWERKLFKRTVVV